MTRGTLSALGLLVVVVLVGCTARVPTDPEEGGPSSALSPPLHPGDSRSIELPGGSSWVVLSVEIDPSSFRSLDQKFVATIGEEIEGVKSGGYSFVQGYLVRNRVAQWQTSGIYRPGGGGSSSLVLDALPSDPVPLLVIAGTDDPSAKMVLSVGVLKGPFDKVERSDRRPTVVSEGAGPSLGFYLRGFGVSGPSVTTHGYDLSSGSLSAAPATPASGSTTLRFRVNASAPGVIESVLSIDPGSGAGVWQTSITSSQPEERSHGSFDGVRSGAQQNLIYSRAVRGTVQSELAYDLSRDPVQRLESSVVFVPWYAEVFGFRIDPLVRGP